MRQAPSSSENSVWRWRWTNSDIVNLVIVDCRSIGGCPYAAEFSDHIDNHQIGNRQFLLPLDRRRRLRADVVDDAVDAANFIDDARGDSREEFVWQTGPVGGHAVAALDGADGRRVLVGSLVAHDADALNRQQYRKTLPQPCVPSVAL